MPTGALLPWSGRSAAEFAPRTTVQVLSGHDQLVAIGPEWDLLVQQAGIAHPFLTHDWILSWWEAFGAEKSLYAVCVREGSRLIAIAPLMLFEQRMYGIPVRVLSLIANEHTPRADFIVSSAIRDRAAAYPAIWRCLWDRRGEWDLLRLNQLAEDSTTLEEMVRVPRDNSCRIGIWMSSASPYMPVGGKFNDRFASLPRGVRSNLKRRLKRLEEQGEVEFERYGAPEPLSAALEQALRMEATNWKGEEGTAIACRDETRRFYTSFAQRAARHGWLYFTFLRLNGQRIAFDLSVIYNQILFKLKPGYLQRFHSWSPGSQLTCLTIEDAFEEGLREVDFLGDADEWKMTWTELKRQHFWLFIYPPGSLGAILHWIKFKLAPAVKKLAQKWVWKRA
jgi:CelD/BcsL family acetyltransferase involved in cellulose biosynthesis